RLPISLFFFFQAEDGIRAFHVTGVQTCALPICNVDPARLRAAQALGATPAQLIRHVVLPSALPDILTGIRIGLGVGWSTLVAAEIGRASGRERVKRRA